MTLCQVGEFASSKSAIQHCAAEFKAFTPYHYSTYEEENESVRSPKKWPSKFDDQML